MCSTALRFMQSQVVYTAPSPVASKGIMFDTGAARASSGNISQYFAYWTMMGISAANESREQALVPSDIGEEL